MSMLDTLEATRLDLQSGLDEAKTPDERNRMGQFATPTALAREVLKHGLALLPEDDSVKFLDPAFGTGSFFSALLASAPEQRIERAVGCEIDPHYGEPARTLWKDTPLSVQLEDFAQANPSGKKANLLICNPPYVRHHHMDGERKAELQKRTKDACGVEINGLSGLYCYFLGLSHAWMEPDGIAGWLIPSEFMGVNYGRQLKQYLLEKVTLLQIHRYDPEDVQFDDALVSSAVVWIKNTPPPANHAVKFTYGGTLKTPAVSRDLTLSELSADEKWTRYPQADSIKRSTGVTLGDLFDIKRGLATGDNSFFIMSREDIEERGLPMECFRPVLPGSRHIPEDEIAADAGGAPLLEKQLFLLDTVMPEDEIEERFPNLKSYLDTGKGGEKPVSDRYLCRSRKPWYAQENRPPAPIICTYMGRNRKGGKPFRFILNNSKATACNVFLMLYPKPILAQLSETHPDIYRTAWQFLNEIDPDELLGHGRVYGGGLHKLEPKELRGFPADGLLTRLPIKPNAQEQLALTEKEVA